jgi:hypothetical protein
LEKLAMATLDSRAQLTILELAKRINLGSLLTIVERLNETNQWMEDAIWLEANQAMSHVTTRRTSIPSGTWRKINEGVTPSSSSTRQLTEGIGILEDYSRVDKLLAELSGNVEAFRSGEDKAFIEGMGQTLSNTLFLGTVNTGATAAAPYGDTAGSPERFNGLPARYDHADLEMVLDAGATGTTNCTSIWIAQWGPEMLHMIYPKNSKTLGVVHENLGEQTVDLTTTAGTPKLMQALVSHFKLHAGLVLRDDRCVRRIASIRSVNGTTNSFNSTGNVHHKLIEALNALPYNGKNAVIYCNKNIKTQMDCFAVDKTNVNYTAENWGGKSTTMFRGVPVRRVDAIGNKETPL